jgi:hypothetical protein
MEVLNCDFNEALKWFDARWNIPRCKSRLHKKQTEWEGTKKLRCPDSCLPSVEALEKSRWWYCLSAVERRLAKVIVKMTPVDTMTFETTQEALRKAADISHRRYMPGAWSILETIGLVKRERVAKSLGDGHYKTTLQVRLTWNSNLFQSLLTNTVPNIVMNEELPQNDRDILINKESKERIEENTETTRLEQSRQLRTRENTINCY